METAGKYIRKNHVVVAVQVTAENMQQVGMWCGRTVWTDPSAVNERKKHYIHVSVVKSIRKPVRAYIGDWILLDSTGFKVYNNQQFENSFVPLLTNEEKRKKVLMMVKDAMDEQDASTYHGVSSMTEGVADKIADKIMELFA